MPCRRRIPMTRRTFLASSAAGATVTLLHPFSAFAQANQAHLRVMETTDIHVHIWPYDYYSDRAVDTVGLARTAGHVADIRAEATNSILLDNGDFLQGNPMGDYIAYERGMKDGDLHPMIQAFNALNFDATTLGNHEFNYGLDFLMRSLAGLAFPFVSANVVSEPGSRPTKDSTLVPPYVILDRELVDGAGTAHPIRIGVIGFVPPQIMTWDRRHLEGRVSTRDIVLAAQAWVPQMKEEGADIVIALSHSGIGAADWTEGMENASVPLAAVEGIDAVLTGHHHLVFPSSSYDGVANVDASAGTIHGKPATMGGFWGSHLGVVDLLLKRDGNAWRIVGHGSEARPISKRNEDRTITALVDSDQTILDSVASEHEETLGYVRRAVGKTATPLHSYFALVADDPSVQIVSQAQKWYIEQMLDGTPYGGIVVLSAAAPFKAGGRGGPDYYTDVPAGDVAIKNVADLYLFPNTVRAVKINGAQLKGWLERSAGIFNQIEPGKPDQVLLHPDFPSYNFDVIDGVSYEIDLSQPSKYDSKGNLVNPDANRIVNLRRGPKSPVTEYQEFIIATNNYRASGGGSFPGAMGDTIVFEAPDTNRDVIVRYIIEQGSIDPKADANWKFAPMPGTTVLFDTGPKAEDYIGDVKGVAIEPAGAGPDGFARFKIKL